MKPYLIEGLDCSGKKTIATKVEEILKAEGYEVDIVIGPTCSKFLQRLDGFLVNLFNIKPGTILDKIRKTTYAYEPFIDGLFACKNKKIIIKVSSHFRAWARAIIENDVLMIRKFEKHKNHHIQFAGSTLLWTDFDERISRHRNDVLSGRTHKIEEKRFFNHNEKMFEAWHAELKKLLSENIDKNLFINTTNGNIDDISVEIAHCIREIIQNE